LGGVFFAATGEKNKEKKRRRHAGAKTSSCKIPRGPAKEKGTSPFPPRLEKKTKKNAFKKFRATDYNKEGGRENGKDSWFGQGGGDEMPATLH